MRLVVVLTLCAMIAACGQGAIVSPASGGAIPTATSAALPAGYGLVADLEEMPFHWPCQRKLVGREARGGAAYVPGPYPKLIGCITDRQGNGLWSADVDASPENPTTMMTGEAWGPTEADGRYIAPGIVEPGWYEARAEAPGYKPVTKRVWVDATRTTVLDFVLEPKE